MIDFTQQLLSYEGEPIIQNEVSTDDEGKKKLNPFDMTIHRCAKFALLDVARFDDGRGNDLNSAETMHKRYKLMRKIDLDPKNVDITEEEKSLLTSLLPNHYDVIIVGQIMDLL